MRANERGHHTGAQTKPGASPTRRDVNGEKMYLIRRLHSLDFMEFFTSMQGKYRVSAGDIFRTTEPHDLTVTAQDDHPLAC